MVGSSRLKPDLGRLNPKSVIKPDDKIAGAKETPDEMRRLIESCIQYNPTGRPIFQER